MDTKASMDLSMSTPTLRNINICSREPIRSSQRRFHINSMLCIDLAAALRRMVQSTLTVGYLPSRERRLGPSAQPPNSLSWTEVQQRRDASHSHL